jgi:hypothetical protein
MVEHVTERESRFRIFWPKVDSLYGAQEAITLAQWACFVKAAMAAVGALFLASPTGDASQLLFASFAAWVGIDGTITLFGAALFALLGFRVGRRSRLGAILSLVLLAGTFSVVGALTPFIVVGLLNGVRGTFAHHKLSREAAGSPGAALAAEGAVR